jgi:hypothetical protein
MSGLDGERGRNRTFNLLIKSQLLCQLSYAPLDAMEGKDERFQEDLTSLTQLISKLLSRHCGRRFVDDSFFVANCKQHGISPIPDIAPEGHAHNDQSSLSGRQVHPATDHVR